jgi:CRISPR type III-A-associated protein Csm2
MDKPKSYSMEEFKRAFGAGDKEANVKKCAECSNPVEDERHRLCNSCFQKSRSSNTTTSNPPRNSGTRAPETFASRMSLPDGYLKDGYFDANGYLQEDLIVKYPKDLAERFYRIRLTMGQLRRFYEHVRKIEKRLTRESFASVRESLLALDPFVADAVGRAQGSGKDYELFREFVVLNVEHASKELKNFEKGFLPHFQYVVAYCTYKGLRD